VSTPAPRHVLSAPDLECDPPTATCSVCGPDTRIRVRTRHDKNGYVEKVCYNKHREAIDNNEKQKARKMRYFKKKGFHSLTDVDFLARRAECAVCGLTEVLLQRPWETDALKAVCVGYVREQTSRHHPGPCEECGHTSSHACEFAVFHKDRDLENRHPDNLKVLCLNCAARARCRLGMRAPTPDCPAPDHAPLSSWDTVTLRF
jgi:hypothetical protein